MNDVSNPVQGWLYLCLEDKCLKRFCRVTKDTFIFGPDENLEKGSRSIKLTHIINAIPIATEKHNTFEIICSHQKQLTFRANSLNDVNRWVLALLDEPEQGTHLSISDFKEIKEIGRGLTSRVKLVKKVDDDRLFALKVLKKNKINKLSTIVTERNLLMRFQHPFITQMYYAFQDSKKVYFALEYVEGGELSKWIQNFKFSYNQKQIFLAEIALAIEYLHQNGIIFRDLKPENILIASDGHVKITDFGLARDMYASEFNYTMCGTSEYVAPEMLKNEGYDFSVDWWSFGVIAYQMFFNDFPFKGENQKLIFDAIIQNPTPTPENCDPIVANFISGLLEKDPQKRLGTNTKVLSDPFFEGIDFEKLYRKEISTDFIPMDHEEIMSIGSEEDHEEEEIIIPNFSFSYDDQPGIHNYSFSESM